MADRLLLTGTGQDHPGIVNALSEAIVGVGGSIEESRMAVLGGEFAIIVLVAGDESVLSGLEGSGAAIGEKTGLGIQLRRTERKAPSDDVLLYHVEALSMDQPGIVHSITEFFSNKNINIETLSTETYAAAHTGTPMFGLEMVVEIATENRISELRLAFLEFCDDMGIDASLDAI